MKKLPFEEYARHYLSYISYLHNKFEVGSEKRCTAAKVYFEVFIEEEIPEGLQGRKLIEETIRHLLNWLLTANIFDSLP